MRTVVLLLVTGVITAGFAADLSGKWVGSIAWNRTRSVSLLLYQKGQRMDGRVAFGTESMLFAIQNGELRENQLTFSTNYAGGPIQFRLTVRRGKLDGYVDYDGQIAKVLLGGPLVTFPVVLQRVPPAYTEEARRLENEGTVVLLVQVDPTGKPNVKRVLRALGNGLDEKAIEAVQTWRFRPAYERGKPITMETTVEVEFRLR